MKKLTCLSLCIFSIYLFSSCIASSMTFGNGKDWIPAEFDAKKDILLIEAALPLKGKDKKMESYMKKNYPYRFEFVQYRDIMGHEGKFADATLYRWALMDASTQISTGSAANPYVPANDFQFLDRMHGKQYPATGKGSYSKVVTFKPVINTIVKNSK